MVLKCFFLVILTFKESLFLETGNITNKTEGNITRVREVFLNLAMHEEIGVKPHYCIINIGLQGYFE